MNVITTLVVLQCQLSTYMRIYIVYCFIVAITFVKSLCYMDEWESDSDSEEEERDGGDYLEKQDQEGEESELFYEAGQRDPLSLRTDFISFSQIDGKIIRICHRSLN